MKYSTKLLWSIPVFLLVVPYATGFLGYQKAYGSFPISPALYATIISACLGLAAAFLKPVFPKSTILLLCLLGIRSLDAVILGRAPDLLDENLGLYFVFDLVYAAALISVTGDSNLLKSCTLLCAAVALGFVCTLNIWEWYSPGYFSNVPGRSAGWLENANDSGIAICLLLALLLALQLPIWVNALIMAGSGLGIYVTLSRGGFVVWLLTCAAALVAQARKGIKLLVCILLFSAVACYVIFQFFDFRTLVDPDQIWRQGLLTGESSVDLSQEDRFEVLLVAINGIMREPLVGYGTGSSHGYPYSPHNQALGVWIDNGILGIVLFLAAVFCLVRECFRAGPFLIVGCVPLILEIPFSQNLLDNKSYLFSWVMLAALAWHAKPAHKRVALNPKELRSISLRGRNVSHSKL